MSGLVKVGNVYPPTATGIGLTLLVLAFLERAERDAFEPSEQDGLTDVLGARDRPRAAVLSAEAQGLASLSLNLGSDVGRSGLLPAAAFASKGVFLTSTTV